MKKFSVKKFVINIIKFYQKNLSHLKKPCCRFFPTCSEYAVEAVEKHGVVKGCLLSFWRIIRCNPFCKGGYDPVPNSDKD
jgi:putative membrane protein insertion efficiency factor